MKTLYLTDNQENIWVDTETNEVGKLNSEDRWAIRTIYQITEPMHVVYNAGEYKEEVDVKKGDILLRFYGSKKHPNSLVVIKSKSWNENINNAHELEQKEKEEWAWTAQNLADSPKCEAESN